MIRRAFPRRRVLDSVSFLEITPSAEYLNVRRGVGTTLRMRDDMIVFKIIGSITSHTTASVTIPHFPFHVIRDMPRPARREVFADQKLVLPHNTSEYGLEFPGAFGEIGP